MRYRLAAENRIAKYLRYAIGEILLVVIGIVIALQLNIANEKRKNKEQLHEYLFALNVEIESNIELINETLDRNIMLTNFTYHFLSAFNTTDPEKVDDSEITNMTASMAPQNNVPLENMALTDLINSGLIKNIENDTLARKIFKIQRQLDFFEGGYGELNILWEGQMMPYLILNACLPAMTDSIDDRQLPPVYYSHNRDAFINNREFSNILTARLMFNFRSKMMLTQTKDWIAVLKDEINAYLAKH
ncbi:hypothetical protein [Maribellus sediminis]|uniref:hypothetical protein n=1 Tax=Maribellus sediminis TaxID=2696285 RepID=UPI001430087F|nr:hypothetical protein [Maribellus sediminis]